MPPLLRQVIDGRVARLGEGGRSLLAVAAVIGHEVPLDLWRSVADHDEEGLLTVVEAATEAQLLIATDDGARFAHTLIREALYGALSPSSRRTWHGRIGEALAVTPLPDPDTVAYHLRQAGDPRAAAWLVRAGERAQAAYAWLSAADRFEAALRLMEERGVAAGERAVLLVRLGQLRRFADRSRSLADLDLALALADAAGDRALSVYALYQRGNVRCLALDFGGGLADEAAALAEWAGLSAGERRRVAGPDGLDPHYGRANYANWCALAGRYAEALVIAAHYPVGGATNTAGVLVDVGYADVLQGQGYACAGLGRSEEASRALAAARVAYRAAQHHEMVAETGRNDLGWVVLPYQADQPAERRRVLAEVEEAEAHIAGVVGDLPPHYARKALLLAEGCWAEAATLARALRAVGISHEWLVGTATLARLARERGDRDLGHQLVREALPDGPGGVPGDRHYFYQLWLQCVAVDLALDDSDLATARAWLAAHDRWLAWSGAVLGRAEGALGWAAYHRAAGDLAAAWQHAEAALAHASAPRQPLALLAAQRLLGELDTQAGRYDDAGQYLARSLALADACAAPYERALTLLAQAEMRAATGRPDEGRALLDEVRAICTPLGARRALAKVDALARGLETGARSGARPATRGDAAGLSPREAEVLRLLAAGRSNKEIAGNLSMSVRTAERHIANLYAKIDAVGRAEAIAYAFRHNLA